MSLWIVLSLLIFLSEGIFAGTKDPECTPAGLLKLEDILFVVQSQAQPYHLSRANAARPTWRAVLASEKIHAPFKAIFTHEHEDMAKAWAVFPLIAALAHRPEASSVKWILVVEDSTEIVSFSALLKKLMGYDECKPEFLGRGLRDREAAIIHHYAFANNPTEFVYPDFAAGWLISTPMLRMMSERLESKRINAGFTIDPQHELAKYIHDEFDKQAMTSVNWLCAGLTADEARQNGCVTNFNKDIEECTKTPVTVQDVFFGVKTTQKFHEDRLPVLLNTWGKALINNGHMVLYSNVTDKSIPTVDCGVPNTERGHCGKLYAIMRSAAERMAKSKESWLVVTDDDTLMSVPRLLTLLSCYDASTVVAIGEVYGYGVDSGHGYAYLTGGGGFVLNLPAVKRLLDASETGRCGCHGDDSPDDMFLGMCLEALKIPIVHRPEFHQARPGEYAAGYLQRQTPVSFHRHSFHDPYDAFNDYLGGNVNTDWLAPLRRPAEDESMEAEVPEQDAELVGEEERDARDGGDHAEDGTVETSQRPLSDEL
eukprot:scpid44921/ scgid0418/ Beta-1,3-glucosyltransferase; Beta-3-glycosyltransferase-like